MPRNRDDIKELIKLYKTDMELFTQVFGDKAIVDIKVDPLNEELQGSRIAIAANAGISAISNVFSTNSKLSKGDEHIYDAISFLVPHPLQDQELKGIKNDFLILKDNKSNEVVKNRIIATLGYAKRKALNNEVVQQDISNPLLAAVGFKTAVYNVKNAINPLGAEVAARALNNKKPAVSNDEISDRDIEQNTKNMRPLSMPTEAPPPPPVSAQPLLLPVTPPSLPSLAESKEGKVKKDIKTRLLDATVSLMRNDESLTKENALKEAMLNNRKVNDENAELIESNLNYVAKIVRAYDEIVKDPTKFEEEINKRLNNQVVNMSPSTVAVNRGDVSIVNEPNSALKYDAPSGSVKPTPPPRPPKPKKNILSELSQGDRQQVGVEAINIGRQALMKNNPSIINELQQKLAARKIKNNEGPSR